MIDTEKDIMTLKALKEQIRESVRVNKRKSEGSDTMSNKRCQKRIKRESDINHNQITFTNFVTRAPIIPYKKLNDNTLSLITNLTGLTTNSFPTNKLLVIDMRNIMYCTGGDKFTWLTNLQESLTEFLSFNVIISCLVFVLGGSHYEVNTARDAINNTHFDMDYIVIDAKTTCDYPNRDDNVAWSVASVLNGIILSNDAMTKEKEYDFKAIGKKIKTQKEKSQFLFNVVNTYKKCDVLCTRFHGEQSIVSANIMKMILPDNFSVY